MSGMWKGKGRIMGLYKKYDFWSVSEGLDSVMDYDYNGNEKDSQYYDFYREQITEMCVLAADMWNELQSIKSRLWYDLPDKKIEFCEKDECSQTVISWWNTAACMLSDVDMKTLLENENIYCADEEQEKEKRIKALDRLTKKQQMMLYTTVIGFITRYLELMAAFETITAVIRELDYHQSAINGKNGASLPDSAYV